eukprot:TRINITY_DN13350_c0_g1_i1.p1 TRINITY_DN13350_c0_g1~~TRINITY_DN13350_c0_g1_i1.p1  ORF type:complete len:213 (-),score=51.30 TRINITY_DN13350_c0_g1_i1:135-773(-)
MLALMTEPVTMESDPVEVLSTGAALKEAAEAEDTEGAGLRGPAKAGREDGQATGSTDGVDRSSAEEEQSTEAPRGADGAELNGAFTWGASLVPAKKVIVEDDSEEAPTDFWNWLRAAWSSHPKCYGLREEEGWSPAVGSIVEELSDCETDISTTASEGDLAKLCSHSSSSSLKALETGLLAHHHRTCQDCHCKLCQSSPESLPQAKADAAKS